MHNNAVVPRKQFPLNKIKIKKAKHSISEVKAPEVSDLIGSAFSDLGESLIASKLLTQLQ